MVVKMYIGSMTNAIEVFKQQQKKFEQEKAKDNETNNNRVGFNSILSSEDSQAKIQARLKAIRDKLKLGKKLSASDMEFLKTNDTGLYLKAVKIEQSRKMLKQQIQNSKSKEEVNRIVASTLSSVKGTDEDVAMEQAALADESSKATKSDKYHKLPTTEEECKKRKNSRRCGSYSNDAKQNAEEERGNKFNCEI